MQQNSPLSAMEPQGSSRPDSYLPDGADQYGVTITSQPDAGLLNLRTTAKAELFRSAVGMTLPQTPNTVTNAGTRLAVWLGPDEYLLMVEDEQTDQVTHALSSVLAGQHYALNTISDALAVYQLEGKAVREVLSKGCSVDLHSSAFSAGQSFQSRLGHAGITCICTAESSITLICRYSFSDYVETWLKDAATEYGYCLNKK